MVGIARFLALAAAASVGGESEWLDAILNPGTRKQPSKPVMQVLQHTHESLQINRSVIGTPLRIGSRSYAHGLGTHSASRIILFSPQPIIRFDAEIGIDSNDRTAGGQGSVVFCVVRDGHELYRSATMRGGQEPERVGVEVSEAHTIELQVDDAGDGPACDHADWAEATLTLAGGTKLRVDEIERGLIPGTIPRRPFSFRYGGQPSDEVLDQWQVDRATTGRTVTTVWTDPTSGLRVHWEVTRYPDFPAADWVLYFENTGTVDTLIIADVRALDVGFNGAAPYVLHRTKGAPSDPTDFEPSATQLTQGTAAEMGGGGGRSSNKDLPFFKVEMAGASAVVAVGWSGQWYARLDCPTPDSLHLTAGMEGTHFLLHPGEKVRSPRILVLHWQGDTLEANAQFRQLLYKHYVATRDGKKPLPTPFCNTCFTRGGGWLNECNAENQISLIRAYAPMGLDALITDAGWFEGGWPMGAGNWTPRKDAYPEGMAPVAATAKEHGMVYGLWFEPERVIAGTTIDKEHPEWVLKSTDDPGEVTRLLNLGLPEARDYMFAIVKGFMDLPGFRFYRQDFNMDPLPYWRHNDAPNRQGITEMKYIEGLYAYWDRIASTWPDGIREECASGGRRIDLETIKRMHIHQDSDYWFDNETDQCQIWGLSQYLPNNTFTTPLIRLDDYSFHSTLATSLCLGWIADDPGFDTRRAKALMDKYREVRHLLIGAWYPLLPYSRDARQWMASQYHRPDLGEGVILVFRRPESPYRSVEVRLHGLAADATYELMFDTTGQCIRLRGSDLMHLLTLTLPTAPGSEMIRYHEVAQ
ncbi:MAG: hypothetical protein AMXMBFR61_15410 [Fimbriimonadales bacterium]